MGASGKYLEIYDALRGFFGPQRWWPAETPFEVVVGAVLTQNTNWGNVEKALSNLRAAGCLTPKTVAALPETELRSLIRPSGYYRQKAARLKRITAWITSRCGDDVYLKQLCESDENSLRNELIAVKGIGPETADSILLYALNKPVFVVDAYTARVLGRHGLIPLDSGYDEIKAECEANLPLDVEILNDFHAQMVVLGKRFCKRSEARCRQCPLSPVLGFPVIEYI